MVCPECNEELAIVQNEILGQVLVCIHGHWWDYDFQKLFIDRLYKTGEEKHAA